jgi:hypothetical protein
VCGVEKFKLEECLSTDYLKIISHKISGGLNLLVFKLCVFWFDSGGKPSREITWLLNIEYYNCI